jgi:hypothetical protein
VVEIRTGAGVTRRPITVPAGATLDVKLPDVPRQPPLQLPGVEARGKVTLVRQGDERWTVDNGVLRLVKERPGGNAFDRVLLRGKELGSFVPVIWQDVGQSLWPKPDAAKLVAVKEDAGRLVLDIEFQLRPASDQAVITAVDDAGQRAALAQRPGTFKTLYCFTVYPGQPWFGVQFRWIQNTDARPWDFQAYFHYALSRLRGDVRGDEVGGPDVPNYYARSRAVYWSDPQAKLHYGIIQGRDEDFRMHFWLDPADGQHADVRREVKERLDPGERWPAKDGAVAAEPTAYVFGATGAESKAAWMPLAEMSRRWAGLEVRIRPRAAR